MTPRVQSYLSSNDWWSQMSDENKMGVQIIEFGFHKINKMKVVGGFKLLRFIKKSKIFSQKNRTEYLF